MSLLFDRGRLGVPLRDDNAAEFLAIFARHWLPRRHIRMVAEADGARLFRRKKNSPAIFRHPHVGVIRPTVGSRTDRGTQIYARLLKTVRPNLAPPLEKAR